MSRQIIRNGQILTPEGIISNGALVIEEGIISRIVEGEPEIKGGEYEVIDACGHYVSPGFIDLHTHGGGGSDFMDGTVDAFLKAAEAHARYGTTYMLPTTLTSTNEELFKTFAVFREATTQNRRGATLGGIHLEGPYFAYNQRGAQDPRYLRDPDPAEYMEILEKGGDIIKRWSLAPELTGALEFGDVLTQRGIMVSMAHTDALFEEVMEAYDHGFRHITHFYSATSTITRRNAFRYAGVIEAGYLNDGIVLEIIADGIHVPSPLLKLVYKLKGSGSINLVTDSMRAAGMPEGVYRLGSLTDGQEVLVEDGVAKLFDRTAFAGSVCTTNRCVRTFHQQGGVSILEAVRMMTETPARLLGLSSTKGAISIGHDADIIIFDADVNIRKVFIGGNLVVCNE